MRHLNDRMMFLLANLTGLPSNITLKNGEKYTGVLSGTSLDPTEMRYVFKMVKRIQDGETPVNGTNGLSDDYIGVGDNHVMSFDIGDVADFNVSNVVLDKTQSKAQNGASNSFRTDTDISGSSIAQERPLQRWEPSAETDVDLSLESSNHTGGEWDQFATNAKLFGVRSNYREEIYTTQINYSDPAYAEKAARAAKLAKEIESGVSTNAHVREERGQTPTDDKGVDEEDKYSGVRRETPSLQSGQPNRYMPPARRAPTSQPTVPGAPHDPAIISSQLARPESASQSTPRTISPAPEKRSTPEPNKANPPPKSEAPVPVASEIQKDAPEKTETKPAPVTKPAAEQVQKPSATVTAAGANPGPRKLPGGRDNATATVEHDLLDSFKQFSAQEKLRVNERTRTLQRESKAVKLNDLRKFSQNFKLNTPVPQDLVPILAKDESKQQLIVEKARRAVEELKTQPAKPVTAPVDPKAQASRPAASKPDSSVPPPSSTTADRQQPQQPRRPGQPQFSGSASMRDRSGPSQNQHQAAARNTGLLSTRLALNQAQHKQQGAVPFNGVPHPIPPTPGTRAPTGPSAPSTGGHTPNSNASLPGLNVRAHEFRPTANTFQPTSNTSTQSSPRPDSAPRQEPPRKIPITSFFGGDRPVIEPLLLEESFNPLKRLLNQPHDEKEQRDCNNNSGIPYPFRTNPTWVSKNDRGYLEFYEPASRPAPISAPQSTMGNNGHMLQHQIPPHLLGPQGGHQNQNPQLTPRHPPAQPHHPQPGHHHYESQPMQYSHSASGMHSSPRNMPPYMYGGQPQPMPGYPGPVPMQNYSMSPSMQHVSAQRPGGPPFGNPGMGSQMMTQQPSNGPYMGMPGAPQMPMYSPAQNHAYPYPNQMSGPPGSVSYPSPRNGAAPLMHHQGSQQGHQPQQHMFMPPGGPGQPMFAQQMPPGAMMRGPYSQPQQPHYGSPHQHPPFPQNHRGTPSGSYSQPMVQQHSMQAQGPPPTGPASHGPDAGDEVK